MTEAIKIAIIVSIAPTLSALGALWAILRTHNKVEQIEKGVNGLQEKLVATTRDEAFARGVKSETDKKEE